MGSRNGFLFQKPIRSRPTTPTHFPNLMAEEACRFFFKNFGLPVTILRPFNVYGPGQGEQFLLTRIAVQASRP